MSLDANVAIPVQAQPTLIAAPTMPANMTAAELLFVCYIKLLAFVSLEAD